MVELNKEKLIIISAGIVAVIGFILYKPLVKELKAKSNEAKTQEAELLKARNTVTFMRTMRSNAQLVTEDNLSIAIDELVKRGRLYNVNFVSIAPKELKRETVYGMVPIEMVLKSRYLELGNFLGALDGLQKSVVKVAEFEVYPHVTEPTWLKTKLILNMYILR